jgi:hypothetical protein
MLFERCSVKSDRAFRCARLELSFDIGDQSRDLAKE